MNTITCSECGSRAHTCEHVIANVEKIAGNIKEAHERAEKAEARVAELEAQLVREQEMRLRAGELWARDKNRVSELEAVLRKTGAWPTVGHAAEEYLECRWCSAHTHLASEGAEEISHSPWCKLVEIGLCTVGRMMPR